ncbi:MAG: acyltransferase [Rhodospirillales bacterium]|nr:acyltransferase [Rhodospirillales bacterium]
MSAEARPIIQPELRHAFVALDGLRGIAAVSVVLFHYSIHLGRPLLPSAYLAVDFFFALSGFVIAHAYERRLQAGQSTGEFMMRRLIRLYPLYWVGMTLPLVVIGLDASVGLPHLNRALAGISYMFGMLFLPTPDRFSPIGGFTFPLNDPAWSLSLEIAVNALYAAALVRLSGRHLSIFTLLAGAALVATASLQSDFNAGNTWPLYLGGWTRVLWSFFAGILLHRLYARRARRQLPPWTAVPLSVLILAIFTAPQTGRLYGLANALVVFPAIIWIGASIKLDGAWAGVAAVLGATSYALYITHLPVLQAVLGLAALMRIDLAAAFWPAIAGTVAIAVYGAYLLDLYYDAPVRRLLTMRLASSGAGGA